MSDHEAIENAVRDYIDGWYAADAERIDNCLHDALQKRTLADVATGELREVTKGRMVELTAAGGGENPEAQSKIVIHHVSGDMASAHVESPDYFDFMHLVRTSQGWRIANILFAPKP